MSAVNPKDLLQFQIRKDVAYLFKSFLTTLEELKQNHAEMILKLENALPKEQHNIIASCDCLTDNNFAYFRKRVLDAGNDCVRAAQEQIEKFKVNF